MFAVGDEAFDRMDDVRLNRRAAARMDSEAHLVALIELASLYEFSSAVSIYLV